MACGPSFYLSLGLPSAKQCKTAPRSALFIASELPPFTELPRRIGFSETRTRGPMVLLLLTSGGLFGPRVSLLIPWLLKNNCSKPGHSLR